MKFQVPEENRKSFLDVVALSHEEWDELISALENVTPTLFIRELADQISEKTRFDNMQTTDMVALLASLYQTRDSADETIETFVQDLCETAKDLRADEDDDRPVNWETFRRKLGEALQLEEPLGITAKAAGVAAGHQRMYAEARILTDIRPVFHSDPDKKPVAAFMYHNLCLSYYEGGDRKNLYIMLDSEDIESLRAAIERASRKESTLSKLLQETSLEWLRPEGLE